MIAWLFDCLPKMEQKITVYKNNNKKKIVFEYFSKRWSLNTIDTMRYFICMCVVVSFFYFRARRFKLKTRKTCFIRIYLIMHKFCFEIFRSLSHNAYMHIKSHGQSQSHYYFICASQQCQKLQQFNKMKFYIFSCN